MDILRWPLPNRESRRMMLKFAEVVSKRWFTVTCEMVASRLLWFCQFVAYGKPYSLAGASWMGATGVKQNFNRPASGSSAARSAHATLWNSDVHQPCPFLSVRLIIYLYIYVYNSWDYILYLSNRRRLLVTWFICDSIGNAFAMLSNGSAISIFQPLGCRCDGVCTRCRQLGCAEAMVQKCHPEQGRADLTSTTSLVITVAHLKF